MMKLKKPCSNAIGLMPVRGTCQFCKAELTFDLVSFREECPKCGGAIHACVQCARYAPGRQNDCAEPNAEPVRDKDKNNRCDWYKFGATTTAVSGLSKAAADELLKKLLKQNL